MEQNAQGQHAQALGVAKRDKAFGHGGSPFGGCIDVSGRRPPPCIPVARGKNAKPATGAGRGAESLDNVGKASPQESTLSSVSPLLVHLYVG